MATHYKTKAFVFKKGNINESDRLFSVFTDDFGRIDIFAKAIRKSASKLRSGIDIFYMCDIEFIQGKNKKILTDAQSLWKPQNIYSNPEKFEAAMKIGEFLNSFIKGEEKDQKILNLLEEVFLRLGNEGFKKNDIAYCYFIWNALSLFGYCPQVHNCNTCSGKFDPCNVYFSDKSEGIICGKCLAQDKSAQKINSDIVKILRIILARDWDILVKLKIGPVLQNSLVSITESAINSFCP
jgi:DNA repair protein RecO (recombination protein O)